MANNKKKKCQNWLLLQNHGHKCVCNLSTNYKHNSSYSKRIEFNIQTNFSLVVDMSV